MKAERNYAAQVQRRARFVKMREDGMTFAQIGAVFGITAQRAGQIYRQPLVPPPDPRRPPGRPRGPAVVKDGASHGTTAGYFTQGCRCDDCYLASVRYQRELGRRQWWTLLTVEQAANRLSLSNAEMWKTRQDERSGL